MGRIFLGVVADDFTGASYAASFLVEAGVPTVLFNGVPAEKPKLHDETAAIVVALKTRTMPRSQAIDESLKAFSWLKEMGAEQFYLKYCSTFDSTSEGNIGPVADAVMEQWNIPYTVLCPSLPVNGRTVRGGNLYVNGILLEESHMKDHPLTPMRDSYIPRLMECQSKYHAMVSNSVPEPTDEPFYLVPDYCEDADGDRIAEIFGDIPFLTGGSGLVGALGRRYVRENSVGTIFDVAMDTSEQKALVLAGSCSAITLKQIEDYQSKGHLSYRIQPVRLLDQSLTRDEIWNWISGHESGVLVYSSANPEELKVSQSYGKDKIASIIEETLSGLAVTAAKNGYHRLIIAGGETSGAVTQALGYEAFYIGKSVAPGVPVMIPLENPNMQLILKSGNFGQVDFFERARTL